MLDGNGNYVANIPDGPPANTTCSVEWCIGDGAPLASVGNDGDLRISRTSGTIYEKVNGAWIALPGGGGGGGSNNQTGTGSPIGANIPDYVGQWYIDITSPYNVWVAVGATSADWVLVAGELT